MKTSQQEKVYSQNIILDYVKATIVSLIVTFACVIIFALLIKFLYISDKFIVPVNLAIKAISVAFGTLLVIKTKVGGLKKGVLFGIIYTTISFLIFSALSGGITLEISLLLDYLFAVAIGAIIGIIKVNTK